MRKNEIETLVHCPDLPSLEYLNLRETKLEKQEEIKYLETLKKLGILNMLGTPLEENLGDGFKKEALILLEDLSLTKFNKEEVTPDDVQEAKELKQERIKEEEEKRKEEEERAREAALAEAEGNDE